MKKRSNFFVAGVNINLEDDRVKAIKSVDDVTNLQFFEHITPESAKEKAKQDLVDAVANYDSDASSEKGVPVFRNTPAAQEESAVDKGSEAGSGPNENQAKVMVPPSFNTDVNNE